MLQVFKKVLPLIYQLNGTTMTAIEQKRNELSQVNISLNRIGKLSKRDVSKMNDVSKKMMVSNLNDLMARKASLLNEIVGCQK